MLKKTFCLFAIVLTLLGCNSLRPESETREIVIGDCLNGAVLNQATFGGPVRCGPQTESVFTEITPAPQN